MLTPCPDPSNLQQNVAQSDLRSRRELADSDPKSEGEAEYEANTAI